MSVRTEELKHCIEMNFICCLGPVSILHLLTNLDPAISCRLSRTLAATTAVSLRILAADHLGANHISLDLQ
jgi:hypothetical protein